MQAELDSKKRALGAVFKTYEDILSEVVYVDLAKNTLFGRPAIYRALYKGQEHMAREFNYNILGRYIHQLMISLPSVVIVIRSMDDKRAKGEFINLISLKTLFLKTYIVPLLKSLEVEESQNQRLAELLKRIREDSLKIIEVFSEESLKLQCQ